VDVGDGDSGPLSMTAKPEIFAKRRVDQIKEELIEITAAFEMAVA
jgi:hypothetical protein